MNTHLARLIPLLLLPPALACSAAGGERSAGPEPRPAPAERADGMTTAELEALYNARVDSARLHFTDADVRFMRGMIQHHAQAIEVARFAPARTTTQSIRTLAARIINAQQDEIATMQNWLRRRGQPVPELHITDDAVMVHAPGQAGGHDDHAMHDMPGMLTAAEIEQLSELSGPAFDRRFLELLIRHHNGAVTMVHELFAVDGAAQDEDAFRLASDIQVDQVTEVARMERMLEAMAGPGGPF